MHGYISSLKVWFWRGKIWKCVFFTTYVPGGHIGHETQIFKLILNCSPTHGCCTCNFCYAPGKHVRVIHTPLHPTFIYYLSKIGVYRGIYNFLIFALKHRLWVLVRTASIKKSHFFYLKIIIFTAVKNRSILHGRVFVMLAKQFWR